MAAAEKKYYRTGPAGRVRPAIAGFGLTLQPVQAWLLTENEFLCRLSYNR